MTKRYISLLALSLGLSWAHTLEGANGWIRLSNSGNTAAYATLTNVSTTESITLVGFEIPLAKSTMLHQTAIANNVSSMHMVHSVVLKPKQALVLKPKSYHLMVSGLKRPIKAGEKIRLIVRLKDGHTQSVWLIVQP